MKKVFQFFLMKVFVISQITVLNEGNCKWEIMLPLRNQTVLGNIFIEV